MLRKRPALRFVLLLIGGILLSDIPVSLSALFGILAVLFLAALFLSFLRVPGNTGAVLLQCAVVLLGMVSAALQREEAVVRRISSAGLTDTVTVYGTVEEEPFLRGKSFRLTVIAEKMLRAGAADSVERRLMTFASAGNFRSLGERWPAGSTVVFRAVIGEFPRARNPGELDYGNYLSLQEIDGILWVVDTIGTPSSGKAPDAIAWFSAQRAAFGRILDAMHGEQQAAFLRGVLFGDRREISPELKESFVQTGTIHILAVSGSNVAVIATALYLVLGFCRVPKYWMIAFTVFGLIYYMLITGSSSSIVRATIMGCIILGSQVVERKADIYNSIALAAFLVLLFNPLQLYDVGFQLSFAAVISIVAIYPILQSLIQRIPARFEEIKGVDALLKLFAVSLSAQLGTLPFTAYYFGRFSVISLMANLVVVPLVGVNLILGCLTLAASAVSVWIAAAYAALNDVLVTFLLGFVQAASSVPFASIETTGFSIVSAVIFYIFLTGILNLGKRPILKRVVAGLLVVGTGSVVRDIFSGSSHVLSVTALDVGQGDALFLKFPNGTSMLVDAGPNTPGFDAGERIVAPFLRRQGITHIDRIIISHPHSDHVGGIPSIVKRFSAGMVVEADSLIASTSHRSLRALVQSRGIWRVANAGTEVSPDPNVRVYCLFPPPLEGKAVTHFNNRSIILKVVYGATSMIMPGDAEAEAEELVYRQFGSFLDAEVLKAGHHGSSTSSSLPFLNSITPNFAIISVATKNKFGHPSADIVRRMTERDIQVLRTDREGAVVMESDGQQWTKRTWRKQEP